jgi:hypothetical protein
MVRAAALVSEAIYRKRLLPQVAVAVAPLSVRLKPTSGFALPSDAVMSPHSSLRFGDS